MSSHLSRRFVATLPPNVIFQARLFRRLVRRVAVRLRYKRWSMEGLPVLFSNSFPKSGTHLLTQILEGFTHLGPVIDSGLPAIVTFVGDSGEIRPLDAILNDIQRLQPGDIAYGHLHAIPEIVLALTSPGVAPFFILRDPRDVVVSHVYYITESQTNHVHHQYFQETLTDFDQRLRSSIQGIPKEGAYLPNIAKRFEPFLGWLAVSQTLTLRYEEFLTQPKGALGRVFDHAVRFGFPSSLEREAAIERLALNINPKRSPTFRRGRIGEWRSAFTDQHKKLFKELAGDLLIQLGYEKDCDW